MNKVYLILAIALMSISCEEKADFQLQRARIIGVSGWCVCWPGYLIEIENTTYYFQDVPDNSSIDLTRQEFPLDVRIKWQPIETNCAMMSLIYCPWDPEVELTFIARR